MGGDGDIERTRYGEPVVRNYRRTAEARPATTDDAMRAAIDWWYTMHLGPCDTVLHELMSELVHVDLYWWKPTRERPFHTFATLGMSDLPMAVPPELVASGTPRFAELMLCLPDGWPVPDGDVSMEVWDDPDAYFPIEALRKTARKVHEFQDWYGSGHTITNGDPPEPIASVTEMCALLLVAPMLMPWEFRLLPAPGGLVGFLGIIPLYRDELQLTLDGGLAPLLDLLKRHGVTELLAYGRPSVVSGI